MKKLFLLALVVSVASINAFAEKAKPLNGSYYFHGESLIDPPQDEPRDTRINFDLTGNTARQLYEKMQVPATTDSCLSDEGKSFVKTIGEMTCIKTGKKYECYFSIDIKNQKIAAGIVC